MNIYKGRVDRNTPALEARISANSKGKYNLEQWLEEIIVNSNPQRVLDIGCGSGKQMKFIKEKFPQCEIVGIDISQEAVEKASMFGHTTCGNFDDLDLTTGIFDLILSFYAIYYSQSMLETIIKYKKRLAPSGVMLLAGFGDRNNAELVDMINDLVPIPHVADFLSADDIQKLSQHYNVSTLRLQNPICFDHRGDFMNWWENHNMYIPEIADEVKSKLTEPITLTKSVLALILRPEYSSSDCTSPSL